MAEEKSALDSCFEFGTGFGIGVWNGITATGETLYDLGDTYITEVLPSLVAYKLTNDPKYLEPVWSGGKDTIDGVVNVAGDVLEDPNIIRNGALRIYNDFDEKKQKAADQRESEKFWGTITGAAAFEIFGGTKKLGIGNIDPLTEKFTTKRIEQLEQEVQEIFNIVENRKLTDLEVDEFTQKLTEIEPELEKQKAILQQCKDQEISPVCNTEEVKEDLLDRAANNRKNKFNKAAAIKQSQEAYEEASYDKLEKLGPDDTKTVACDGGPTLSGWETDDPANKRKRKDFFNDKDLPMKIKKYGEEIGYDMRQNSSVDYLAGKANSTNIEDGFPGKAAAAHGEKQQAFLHPNKPIGVSKPMCPCCRDFFQVHANATGYPQVITDPYMTRIYYPGEDKPEEHPHNNSLKDLAYTPKKKKNKK
jgi:hypothetical protein